MPTSSGSTLPYPQVAHGLGTLDGEPASSAVCPRRKVAALFAKLGFQPQADARCSVTERTSHA